MPTPHNEAKKGEIAKVVLMPGDPNRAKWIADNFLHDVKLVNQVRGQFCFTGLTKNNKRISVMSSGMGHPSIGIYSHELFAEYDVDLIIRVGTCGSYQENINFFDVLIGEQIMTDSNYGAQLGYDYHYEPKADASIVAAAKEVLEKKGYPYHSGKVFAADVFYDFKKDIWKDYAARGAMAVEMESFALYINAAYLGKKALTMLTVTDHFLKEGRLTPEQRQTGLKNMIDSAIELAEKYA
ncbi:MAG: purine-nucleoside phosphorylase [Bacilli bacterium]|nr:purine-nucleoside phosphorylase [Bacilli bacterium]